MRGGVSDDILITNGHILKINFKVPLNCILYLKIRKFKFKRTFLKGSQSQNFAPSPLLHYWLKILRCKRKLLLVYVKQKKNPYNMYKISKSHQTVFVTQSCVVKLELMA